MSDFVEALAEALESALRPCAVEMLEIGRNTRAGSSVKAHAAFVEMYKCVPAAELPGFFEGILEQLVNALHVLDALTVAYEEKMRLNDTSAKAAEAKNAALEGSFQGLLQQLGVYKIAVGSGGDTDALVKAGRELLAYIEPRMVVSQVPASQVH
jgi:hypothetical protein